MIRRFVILSLIALTLPTGYLASQDQPSSATAERKAGKKASQNDNMPMAITPEREAAVMTFVKLNHEELAGLLTHLKENQPKEYERAVKELHRTTERLAQIKERDSVHYGLEVDLWTAQSRVQLLTAKLKMGSSAPAKDELRDALADQLDARLAVLRHQRQRAADRLNRMDGEIAKLEADRQTMLERQLDTLTASAVTKPAKRGAKKSPKSAVRAGKKDQN